MGELDHKPMLVQAHTYKDNESSTCIPVLIGRKEDSETQACKEHVDQWCTPVHMHECIQMDLRMQTHAFAAHSPFPSCRHIPLFPSPPLHPPHLLGGNVEEELPQAGHRPSPHKHGSVARALCQPLHQPCHPQAGAQPRLCSSCIPMLPTQAVIEDVHWTCSH